MLTQTDLKITTLPDLNDSILLLSKGVIVVCVLLYFVFAGLVARQTFLMSKTLRTSVSFIMQIIAVINFLFACAILVMSVLL